MANFRKSLLIGIATIALGAGSLSAFAAQPGCERPGHGPAGTHGRFDEQSMQERMAKRQAELHDKLKLNASQEGAWRAFVERMKPAERPARPDRAEMARLPAPERMEKMLALMKQHEAKMADRVAATKEFYAVLTPDQQKTFNDQFGPGHGRRFGPR